MKLYKTLTLIIVVQLFQSFAVIQADVERDTPLDQIPSPILDIINRKNRASN